LFDNGRGGIYSGSLTGTLVGNILYENGIVVLTKGDLSDFGGSGGDNFEWNFEFNGVHRIPVNIYKCRAKSGEANCSTNNTFYKTGSSGDYKNQREILVTGSTYITKIGLFDADFRLVGLASLAQPIKKAEETDILFRLKLDF
jgi:hypothetical protein